MQIAVLEEYKRQQARHERGSPYYALKWGHGETPGIYDAGPSRTLVGLHLHVCRHLSKGGGMENAARAVRGAGCHPWVPSPLGTYQGFWY